MVDALCANWLACLALNSSAQLFHAGRSLLQCAGLLLGAGRQIVIALSNFGAGSGYAFGALAHRGDNLRQIALHSAQAGHQTGGVTGPEWNAAREIALRYRLGDLGGLTGLTAQLFEQAARYHPANTGGHQQGQRTQSNDQQTGLAVGTDRILGRGVHELDLLFRQRVDGCLVGRQHRTQLGTEVSFGFICSVCGDQNHQRFKS